MSTKETITMKVFVTIFIWMVCLLESLQAKQECPYGQYFNSKSCINCTKCPKNLIVRKECSYVSDTVCGPFVEFDTFRNEMQMKDEDEDFSVELDFSKNMEKLNTRIEIDEVPTNSPEDQYWKRLAFSLIGVLCVLIIVATMVVWYACRKLQVSVQMKRTEDYDSDDADNGYVVIRSIRHMAPPGGQGSTLQPSADRTIANSANYHLLSQQRLVRPYRPKRRLLNEYADEVFESEDSAGSRTSHRVLAAIPEQMDTETTSTEQPKV